MQLQITETQKRSKQSDIFSIFLSLTWLIEGFSPLTPLWLLPWICGRTQYPNLSRYFQIN